MRVAVVVVVLAACRSTTSGTAVGPRAEEAPGSAVHFSRPPVVDGSRRACLEPPHVPDADALADGTPVTHSDQRRWEIVLEGEREMTGTQVSAELEELRAQPDAFSSHSAGPCTHDGDCMVLGCGNHCVTWEYGGAHEAATCEGYSFPRPVFCGCVERECEWFTQP